MIAVLFHSSLLQRPRLFRYAICFQAEGAVFPLRSVEQLFLHATYVHCRRERSGCASCDPIDPCLELRALGPFGTMVNMPGPYFSDATYVSLMMSFRFSHCRRAGWQRLFTLSRGCISTSSGFYLAVFACAWSLHNRHSGFAALVLVMSDQPGSLLRATVAPYKFTTSCSRSTTLGSCVKFRPLP